MEKSLTSQHPPLNLTSAPAVSSSHPWESKRTSTSSSKPGVTHKEPTSTSLVQGGKSLNSTVKPFTLPTLEVELFKAAQTSQSLTHSLLLPSTGRGRMGSSLEQSMNKLAEASRKQNEFNKQLTASSQLPMITVPVFSGDPLLYHESHNAFHALIDSKPSDTNVKLNFLRQYIKGKPKRVVEHYLLIGISTAYQKVKDVLEERYGNSSVISTVFTSKLEKWSRSSPRDETAQRELSDFLDKITAARPTVPSLGVLVYAKENAQLVDNLPFRQQVKRCHPQMEICPWQRELPFIHWIRWICQKGHRKGQHAWVRVPNTQQRELQIEQTEQWQTHEGKQEFKS